MPKNYSKKREAVLDVIQSTTCHPTADWILQEVRKKHPDMSLATVYRNIALFKEEGSVISVGTIGGKERFDGNTHHHGHLVCHSCNTIIDFDLPKKHSQLATQLEEATQHHIDQLDYTAYGVCAPCLETEKSSKQT